VAPQVVSDDLTIIKGIGPAIQEKLRALGIATFGDLAEGGPEGVAAPGLVMMAAGTLDDTNWVKPRTQIYCASAQPWSSSAAKTKNFDRMPS
jgi:hypothetical protein